MGFSCTGVKIDDHSHHSEMGGGLNASGRVDRGVLGGQKPFHKTHMPPNSHYSTPLPIKWSPLNGCTQSQENVTGVERLH
jgi:hypothetical protein